MVGDASSSPTKSFDACLILFREAYLPLDLPCLHRLHAARAGAFVHWIVRQHEMTTTVTNKPVPVATRAHRHGLSTLYAVRA